MQGRACDIVVLCKTCKYETSVRGWVTGKNKYQCYCTGLTVEEVKN